MERRPPVVPKKKAHKDPADLQQSTKRPYHRPQLTCYGDVRDLTLGASGDTPESGGNFFPW